MTLQQTGLWRISLGRIGVAGEVPLFVPEGASWDGDSISLAGSAGGWGQPGSEYATYTPADGLHLRDQLRGLDAYPNRPREFVCPSDLTQDAWVYVDSCKVTNVDLLAGEFDWSLTLVRVPSGTVFESVLTHRRRAAATITAANADPFVGVPPRTSTYRRAAATKGGLAERAVAPESGGGDVLVDVWAGNDDVAPAYWTCPPGGGQDAAARLRTGAALLPPSLLHQASSWWDARSYSGSGDLLDLVGSVDGTLEDPTPGRLPLFCPFSDGQAQYAFFPGWADEGASTTRVAAISGTFDVRWDADDHGLAVGGPNLWVCHQGSDDDELGFAVGFDEADGQMVMLFSPDGSFVGTVQSTVAPTLGTDGQRRIAYDSATGDVTFYERATGVDLASNVGWTQVGAVVAAGGTGSFNSDAAQVLAISGASGASTGSEPEAQFDGQTMGYRGHLRRLIISHGGGTLRDFDPDLAARPFSSFTGGEGETWTFFRAASTSSYRVDVIDRPCFQLGNGAHFAFGDNFDSDATTSLTVSWWGWHQADTPVVNGWIGKIATLDGSTQGYVIADIASVGGQGGSMLSLPGPAVGQGGFPSQVATGVLACWTAVIDRADDTLTLYRDGTAATPIDISGVGSVTNAVDFAIGLVGGAAGQMAVCGAAVWGEALGSTRVARVAEEALDDPFELPDANTIDEQLAAFRTVEGLHLGGDVDLDGGWLVENGLVRCFPVVDVGDHFSSAALGDQPELVVQCWGGTGWESPIRLQQGLNNRVVDLAVVENLPEVVRLRLVWEDVTEGARTLHLELRRGSRLVEGVWAPRPTASQAAVIVWSDAPTTTSGMTDGLRLTDDDPDGNRWVLCSALGTPTADASGPFYVSQVEYAGDQVDFGVGHVVGGAAASGIDTAAALDQQHAAWVTEDVLLRRFL